MASRKDSKGRALKSGEYERKDGRYYYVFVDILGKRQYIYAKDLKELRSKEKENQKLLDAGIDISNGKITLNDLFQKHIELKTDLRETTKENYIRMWDCRVKESIVGNAKISDLKPLHIQILYNDFLKDGLKRNTIKLLHNLIFQTLEMAVDNDYIIKNPAKGGMEHLKADSVEKTPLTEQQIIDCLEYCKDNNYYSCHVPFIIIAIGTCMRCGELTGLTWNDVDMKSRTINVNHQLVYKNYGDGCKFHINEPKTDSGKRIIPMTDSVHRAFVEMRKLNFMFGRTCNAEIDGYTDFIFLSSNGQPYATNAVNNFLLNIEKAYNKEHPESNIPHLSAHILRHTGCTLYASAGMDIKALQDVMGHSDASITMNTYNHASFERTEKEIQRLNNVIGL